MSDVATFIEEGSGERHPAFKFATIGTTITGTITEKPRVIEVDKMGAPGVKERKLVIAITTDAGDTFAVWAKPGFMLSAIGDAAKKATGGTELQVGARLAIRYSEDRDTGKPQPAKVFVAEYAPPAAGTDVGSLL